MKRESFRGRYWRCSNCREFVPDEMAVCPKGHPRYEQRSLVNPNIHVSKIPPGLRGDKMFVYRQNGKQILDKMQAKQKEQATQRVKGRIDRTPHGPGSLEHYRGEHGR